MKSLTWQNYGQYFVAQKLIKIVKLKCCGIKGKMKDKINSFIWQHFLLLTFFLAYIQTTEAKGQSPCPSYGASIINGDLYCGHQEDSVFAMHSVMKFPQALYVADYLHKKGLSLSDSVLVHKDSLDAETWGLCFQYLKVCVISRLPS